MYRSSLTANLNKDQKLSLLKSLISAKTTADLDKIIDNFKRDDSVRWRLLGDEENNNSTVSIGSDPDISLVERVTNSMDAIFERLATQDKKLLTVRSPRLFASKVGLNVPRVDDSTKRRGKKESGEAEIELGIWRSGNDKELTFEIIDNGTGIQRTDMPGTIFSLNKNNKITKWYLLGTYGHGASTSFRWSPFTIIATKPFNGDNTSFSIVKYFEAAQNEKAGKYKYLVADDDLPLSVKTDVFKHSTLVKHIGYRSPNKTQPVIMYYYGKLNYILFDPVVGFKLVYNTGQGTERRTIYGSKDRLTRSELIEKKDEIDFEYEAQYGRLTLRYWLFKNRVSNEQKATFIDVNSPIIVTYFGQSHGVLPKGILQKCALPYLENDLVVQLDCDKINATGRRNFFSSTREEITSEAKEVIRKIIVDTLPGHLENVNKQRELNFLTQREEGSVRKLRERLAEMLDRIDPVSDIKISGGSKGKGKAKRKKIRKEISTSDDEVEEGQDLELRPYPTELKIINKQDPIVFRKNETVRIHVYSNVVDNFLTLRKAFIDISGADKYVDVKYRKRDFQNGRFHFGLMLKDEFSPGTTFDLSVFLKVKVKINEDLELNALPRRAVVLKPHVNKPTNVKVRAQSPEIEQVHKDHPFYQSNNWNEDNVADVKKSRDKTVIYVSLENKHLQRTLREIRYAESKKKYVKWQYVCLIAFYVFKHDKYKEILTNEERAVYEKMSNYVLDVAALTILTSLTSEEAFNSKY